MNDRTQLLLDKINRYHMNPSSIVQDAFDTIEEVLQGKDIVDPTNAFTLLLEMNATGVAAAIALGESVSRKTYPHLAATKTDLYRHFSDYDFNDIYATPALGFVNIAIPMSTIESLHSSLPTTRDYYRIYIPKDTLISVNGVSLSLLHNLYINVDNDLILTAWADATISSPFYELTDNKIDCTTIGYGTSTYMQIRVPVAQVASASQIYTLSSLATFDQDIAYTDQFSVARVWLLRSGKWVEIATTYSDNVYDALKPTAKLLVGEKSINVVLPDIYGSTNQLGNSVRIDIYTTKGEYYSELGQISPSNFSIKWLDYSSISLPSDTYAISNISNPFIYSTDKLSGGRKELTLSQLKERVIYRSNVTRTPLRLNDIKVKLSPLGYQCSKILDNITDKVYLASKHLAPRNSNGVDIYPLATTFYSTINVSGITKELTDEMLYQFDNMVIFRHGNLFSILGSDLVLLSKGDRSTLSALKYANKASLVTQLNAIRTLYLPYTYIIENKNGKYQLRTYLTDNPTITKNYLESQNSTISYGIATASYTTAIVETGIRLNLVCNTPNKLSDVYAQLVWADPNGIDRYYLDGVLEKSDKVTNSYVFIINTKYVIYDDNTILLNNFKKMSDSTTASIRVNIDCNFQLYYSVQSSLPVTTLYDNEYSHGSNQVFATKELMSISLVRPIVGLQHIVQELPGEKRYMKYSADVQATYLQDVYLETANGKAYIINVDNSITFTKLHSTGDLMFDGGGVPVLLHKAGDYVLDTSGKMIPDNSFTSDTFLRIPFVGIDARYLYSDNPYQVALRDTFPELIESYINSELNPIRERLAERHELLYTPLGQSSRVQVRLNNGTTTSVKSTLDVAITCYVSATDVKNVELVKNIKLICRTTIVKYIGNSYISNSGLYQQLLNALPAQVVSLTIDSFISGGLEAVAIVDESSAFTIEEVIQLTDSGELLIDDTIVIQIQPIK